MAIPLANQLAGSKALVVGLPERQRRGPASACQLSLGLQPHIFSVHVPSRHTHTDILKTHSPPLRAAGAKELWWEMRDLEAEGRRLNRPTKKPG